MKNIEIDIEELRDKMNDSLKGSGWEPALSPFINGLDFDMIVTKLVSLVNVNRRFTPQFKDIFNDGFVSNGAGFGATYDFRYMPIRIDYLFNSKSIKVNNFIVYPHVFSDHKAISIFLDI